MKKQTCEIVLDLMEQYQDDTLRKETKQFVEEHLTICTDCNDVYHENQPILFEEIDDEEPPKQQRKNVVVRLKRTFVGVLIATFTMFIVFGMATFAVGHYSGIYGARFQMAYENDWLIDVEETIEFDGQNITLEKVLTDSTVTALIFNTTVDLNGIDSITMYDDMGNYYRKTHSLFTGSVQEFSKDQGYTILNFETTHPDAQTLYVEMINWENQDNDIKDHAIFTVSLDETTKVDEIRQYQQIGSFEYNGLKLDIVDFVQSASQTQMDWIFDHGQSSLDGISFGWYLDEDPAQLDAIELRLDSGELVSIISAQDILHEWGEEGFGLSIQPYRILTNPIDANVNELRLRINELYGFVRLDNEKIAIDTTGENQIDKTYVAGDYTLYITHFDKTNDQLIVHYRVEKDDQEINDALLDARIRVEADTYAVPQQGTDQNGTVVFDIEDESEFVITLARLGQIIDFEEMTLSLEGDE